MRKGQSNRLTSQQKERQGPITIFHEDAQIHDKEEVANFMLAERYFPYILFLEGSNFLTQNVTVTRPDGREVTLVYNDGTLNRLDRLTAANYGMPINTNLCKNRFVNCNSSTIMLQAASIYTKGEGGRHWNAEDMIMVMLKIARTSLKMLGTDLFDQLSKK